MADRKPHTTRTLGPLHFEDLDPKRFEGLIRELIYDFRDWQSIEATGLSGADDGIDIRAYEKTLEIAAVPNDPGDEDELDKAHPMDGNMWTVQVKREKRIGPKKLGEIIEEIDSDSPPYGYILAASTVFSKRSYDMFREALREKGVMEFYLWGRPELESMLLLPVNDRILFAFFGISLVTKARSRVSEIRSAVSNKNKLVGLIGDVRSHFDFEFMVRDINADEYPYRGEYSDFEERPRWVVRSAQSFEPHGLLLRYKSYPAFVDRQNRQFDFDKSVDLNQYSSEPYGIQQEQRGRIRNHARRSQYMPRRCKGRLDCFGVLKYSDIRLIDPVGDSDYSCPHVFLDFSGRDTLYEDQYAELYAGDLLVEKDDGWSRVEYFSTLAETTDNGADSIECELPDSVRKRIFQSLSPTLYADDDRYSSLLQKAVLEVDHPEYPKRCYRVTHAESMTLYDYKSSFRRGYEIHKEAESDLDRQIEDEEVLRFVELELDKNGT